MYCGWAMKPFEKYTQFIDTWKCIWKKCDWETFQVIMVNYIGTKKIKKLYYEKKESIT